MVTDVPEADIADFIVPSGQDNNLNKNEKSSTNSELDSEESMMDDDLEVDLDQTQEDKSNQSPLFLNFTCTVKSRLQQYSVSLRNIAACLS